MQFVFGLRFLKMAKILLQLGVLNFMWTHITDVTRVNSARNVGYRSTVMNLVPVQKFEFVFDKFSVVRICY
jgi:hypothetical protein